MGGNPGRQCGLAAFPTRLYNETGSSHSAGPGNAGAGERCAMATFWKRLFGGGRRDAPIAKGQYGVDYVGVAELMQFNRNLVEALKHERSGVEFYTRFLREANDERGREMYRKLLEEEIRHLRMVEEEIEEHRKQGIWS